MVSAPFAAGCFSTFQAPLPEPAERSSGIHGVVRNDGEEGERIEFRTVNDVRWSDSEVVIVGTPKDSEPGAARDQVVTRSFVLATLDGVLIRRIDPAKTSGIVAAVFVGAIATAAFLLTGQSKEGQPLPGVR